MGAGEYLEKKKEKAMQQKSLGRGSNSDLRNGKGLGTLHEDKPLDAKTIVAKTDVISAMEAVEGAVTSRKKTPPGQSAEDMKKKALIRSLGRRPSEDKIALYVRKPSSEEPKKDPKKSSLEQKRVTEAKKAATDTKNTGNSGAKKAGEVKLREKKSNGEDSKKSAFLQDMARRSLEVPTDFLDKIDEEKKEKEEKEDKKYPFHRTTTPNTLREHLKETLAKNLGSSTDLAETIHAIRDDEILDTFNIDSENIETPPIQRRAFRHKSFRLPEEDAESDIGSDFSGRRKNHEFKTISGDGRPLGDREMLLKKKKASEQDLSSQGRTDLSASSSTIVKPRNSNNLFGDRKPMSSLNGGSHPSINSSTRSLNRGTTTGAGSSTSRTGGGTDEGRRGGRPNSVRSSESISSLRSPASNAVNQRNPTTRPTSSKENLSRSSSGASRSSVANS